MSNESLHVQHAKRIKNMVVTVLRKRHRHFSSPHLCYGGMKSWRIYDTCCNTTTHL